MPHGNWKTVTFIAALRHDRVTAPFVLEGPMTGEMFKAYTEQCLAPMLKKGDIVFMDNVSVHKVDGIEEAIEARGAIPFYLPAYSPDLNPIEQLFAKLKALLRKSPHTLSRTAHSPSHASARPSPGVWIKSPGPNALHTSQIRDMVNLNGQRSNICPGSKALHRACERGNNATHRARSRDCAGSAKLVVGHPNLRHETKFWFSDCRLFSPHAPKPA